MRDSFFERPILNSPYEYPSRHWELDDQGQPTQKIIESRRQAEFITPIPKPRKRKGAATQEQLLFNEGKGLSTDEQQYDHTAIINGVRQQVDKWRRLPNPSTWQVTPETALLLHHWRHHDFSDIRPFFCQIEAVETAISLTEVAPNAGKVGKSYLEHLANANKDANPEITRLALKLATGAGKTTVMAMLVAWQTINAVRHPQSKRFTRGFLIVAPGLTIRDRLRVLQPNDPDSYYLSRELIPGDMLADLERAKIVITNYHAFKLRERMDIWKGGRSLLQGRGGALNTLETEGQMLQRVMPDLMGMKNILVLNDEAHHCYREKPDHAAEGHLKGDDRKEAEKNNEAARLWISGLEAINRKLGVTRVIDLSATPFFLRGSSYAEGTLFPWTMSDFSLMDAIECGIVKLPRVPVADNIPGGDMPKFRNLWEHIRTRMPKKGRGKAKTLDPLSLPVELQTALQALYGHYEKTYGLWEKAGVSVPPCFIVVCNNTPTSKLVYDFISGFHRENDDGLYTRTRLSTVPFSGDNLEFAYHRRRMLMKREFTRLPKILVLPAIAIFCPGLAYSMDLSFRPRVDTGIEYYKIEQDNLFQLEGDSSESASSLQAADWMPILSGGMTIIANRFYVDVSGLKAFNGEDDVNRKFSTLDLGNPGLNSTGSVRGDSDFDRWEYSVSLGYLLTDNLSLFAGYRKSEVDLKFKSDLILNGSPAGAVRVDGTFEQDGPFVGASYGWRIDNAALKGTLSGSLAFAALDGKLNIDDISTTVVPEEGVPDDSSDGDTIGMKVGFTWIGSLPVDDLSYSLGVDGYKYDFDANDDDPDVTETVINLKAGLAYRF